MNKLHQLSPAVNLNDEIDLLTEGEGHQNTRDYYQSRSTRV